MIRLLICGFGPFPQAPDNPAALAVERLRARGWSPPGAQADYAVLPTVWSKAAERALAASQAMDADAVLLVGVAVGAQSFRLETLARNRASQVHVDQEGRLWPLPLIDPQGPDQYDVGAPVDAMLGAIGALGLPVTLSQDAGEYLCNFTLYRLLAQALMTAFLHVPALGADVSLEDIVGAVRAAAEAFATELR
jgi:pyroglutamyl-peptidase